MGNFFNTLNKPTNMNMCVNCIFGGCEMEGKTMVCHIRVPLLGDFQFYSEITPLKH